MSRSKARPPEKKGLRDLLDHLDRGRALLSADKSPDAREEAAVAAGDIRRVGEQAMCFDVGDYDSLCRRKIIPENCRLPFEVCWLRVRVTDDQEPFFIYVLAIDQVSEVLLVELMEIDGNWAFMGACAVDHIASDTARYIGPDHGADSARLSTAAFLSALNCRNIETVERPPNPKRQKIRARQGKKPLFSYWTLHLDGVDATARALGGTHSSPRVHLRRGHPRQYAPGQWTWVQPHAVGHASLGMVHKDYEASALTHRPDGQTHGQ